MTYRIMDAVNAGANATSVPFSVGGHKYGVQVTFSSATLAGTLTLECSLDKTTWTTVGSSSAAIAAGENQFYNTVDVAYEWARLVWTYSAGAGTMTADVNIY